MESSASGGRSARWERAEREMEFARIVAFTDGVIAIAITLLVLNLDQPLLDHDESLALALAELWPAFVSYVLSFLVVGRFWLMHHRFFAGLERFDPQLMTLNLIYLALIVLVPFTTDVLDTHGDTPDAPIIYAAVLAAAGFVNWAMVRHALKHDLMRDEAAAETDADAALFPIAVFLGSMPLAFVSPHLAEISWALILVISIGRRKRRSR